MSASTRSASSAWLVVALLFPVALLNYLERQMLATMGLSIKAEFAELQDVAGAENFGWLMSIFIWVYAFCSPVSGFIATAHRPFTRALAAKPKSDGISP